MNIGSSSVSRQSVQVYLAIQSHTSIYFVIYYFIFLIILFYCRATGTRKQNIHPSIKSINTKSKHDHTQGRLFHSHCFCQVNLFNIKFNGPFKAFFFLWAKINTTAFWQALFTVWTRTWMKEITKAYVTVLFLRYSGEVTVTILQLITCLSGKHDCDVIYITLDSITDNKYKNICEFHAIQQLQLVTRAATKPKTNVRSRWGHKRCRTKTN